ncbi:MFS transporter [Rothia sp. CCM 9418]|uniref:MFS transporter n=1 Tax=Rothia sp. CCM 9418 TaxID=3402661 RepID=UPI003AEE28B0
MSKHAKEQNESVPLGTRGTITAWALWDAGGASFNAVMTTFVFTVYLTSKAFGDPKDASEMLSTGLAIAGLLIALLAPVTGQRADASGQRTLWLAVNTFLTAVLMALCFFTFPEPQWLLYGVTLICAANVMNEFAIVNYNALLPELSTPSTVGKISGIGWSAGYFGGIIALGIVLFAFVGLGSDTGFLGISPDNSLNIRAVAIFSAVWSIILSTPLVIALYRHDRRHPKKPVAPKVGLIDSYKKLWATLKSLYKNSPKTLAFLFASAIFRDGFTGIFTFGGIVAAGTFGFSTTEIIIFAIAGNVVAGIGALLGGKFDDLIGPKRVIVSSLVCLLISATPLLFIQSPIVFWICGLGLCAFVGPAQSASRTYLSRITPPGHEGEIFGLYSTTGRAAAPLAPLLFGLFVWAFGAQIWGILGIMVVLVAGLLLTLPLPRVHRKEHQETLEKGQL